MKSFVAIAILFVFSGMALLGFLGVICDGKTGSCCISELARGMACPHEDPIASLNFHVGALKNFSNATAGASSFALAALLLSTFFAWFFLSTRTELLSLLVLSPIRGASSFDLLSLPSERKLTKWFSLHEHSPSYM
ncbi:MAG: hypothetical protein Q7R73_05310 [bacterium]|nr:hypothetical protein [bacterium]